MPKLPKKTIPYRRTYGQTVRRTDGPTLIKEKNFAFKNKVASYFMALLWKEQTLSIFIAC